MDRQQRFNHMVHHFRRRPFPVPFPYADQRFRLMMLHKFRYPMKYGPRIPIRPPIQGGRAPFLQARPLDENHLEEIMEGDDREQKESLVSILLHYNIFMLMMNRRMHCIYCMLVDACEGQQLDLLVVRVLLQGYTSYVQHSTNKGMSFCNAYSTFQSSLMRCFMKKQYCISRIWPHEVGCKSLNDCIAVIGGDQRVRLLNQIADVSDFHSYDPYGGGFSSFYDAIVRRLEPRRRALHGTAGGKNVLSIMEADDEG
ncbi:UNVERIFIED_CONTAM: hypothetical protein Sangu_2569600 [Sesamum angustifolium]|uniref:Uncharacterized protein n=1 Tax=Sesamum angustifolium TaxID=2727405 RepID=A0AAW2J8A5_9LAMI